MADSVEQVRRTAALLRSWGFVVHEVGGWENRGAGDLTTRGRLEHHTAGSRSGDTPSLRVVTFGREGLRNSLCRFYVSRSGIIYLVARRVSWHAGRGVKGSNSTLSGTEAENSGTGEPWTQRSLEAQAAISAAECIVYGLSPQQVWDHREHAPGRKPDRAGIDSHAWRQHVTRAMAGASAPVEEDEDMIKFNEKSDRVRRLQRQLSMYLYYTGGFDGGGTRYADLPPERNPHNRTDGSYLRTDGHYGTVTASAMWHAARRWELNRRVDGATTLFPFDHRNPDLDVIAAIIAHLDAFLAENKV